MFTTKIPSETRREEKVQADKESKTTSVFYVAPHPYPPRFPWFTRWFGGVSSSASSSFDRVGKTVLPAQNRTPITLQTDLIKELEKYELQLTKVKIQTFDDATLDGIEINPTNKKSSVYIIKFNGNGCVYEDNVLIQQMMDDAYRLDATIIAFNYRGVGSSEKTPACSKNLVADGIAEVQRILDQGIPPKKIVLDGLSLGGGIATLVAEYFHDKGIRVNLFNDRSFSSISDVGMHMIYYGELPRVFQSISSSLISFAGWEINAAQAYATIPAQYKTYMFVTDETKSHPRNQGDGVIPQEASLHSALNQHGFFFKMICESQSGGHNAPRKQLQSTDSKLNGEEAFDRFVKRVTK